jgi:hypothetical protein
VTGQAFIVLGLVLDIVGATLIFFFGLPQKVIVEDDNWVEKRYPRLGLLFKYLGLPLLILGFLCQLIGTLKPD